jgi:hypothetical protein
MSYDHALKDGGTYQLHNELILILDLFPHKFSLVTDYITKTNVTGATVYIKYVFAVSPKAKTVIYCTWRERDVSFRRAGLIDQPRDD